MSSTDNLVGKVVTLAGEAIAKNGNLSAGLLDKKSRDAEIVEDSIMSACCVQDLNRFAGCVCHLRQH